MAERHEGHLEYNEDQTILIKGVNPRGKGFMWINQSLEAPTPKNTSAWVPLSFSILKEGNNVIMDAMLAAHRSDNELFDEYCHLIAQAVYQGITPVHPNGDMMDMGELLEAIDVANESSEHMVGMILSDHFYCTCGDVVHTKEYCEGCDIVHEVSASDALVEHKARKNREHSFSQQG